MLAQIIHVDVAVSLHPVFVGFDGERPDQAQAAFGIGEDAHDIGATADFLVQPLQHVGGLEVLVVLARQPEEGQRLFDVLLHPAGQARILSRPFGQPGSPLGQGCEACGAHA